jgi:Zn-dependent peptidase ImmA (M78 family)
MAETVLQNLDQLEEAMAREGLEASIYAGVLERLRAFCGRYAALERALIGDVPVSFPAYLLGLKLPEDPLAAGEEIARRERERLAPGTGEAGDPGALLDREGLKVYRPSLPATGDLEGFFLFDSQVGPVLVVDGGLAPGDAAFVFARLHAHFLFDNDPYCIRFVRRGDGVSPDAVQMRSRSFAGALLVNREGLEEYLHALGHPAGQPITDEIARQLLVYFEVGTRALLERLLALGHLQAADLPAMITALETRGFAAEPEAAEPETAGREAAGPEAARSPTPSAIPERFLRLALEAHAREQLTLQQLAEHLETDASTAQMLAARFRLEQAATEATFRETEAGVDLGHLEESTSRRGTESDADEADEELEH